METTVQRSQRQRSSAIVVAAIAGECLWFHMIAIYWSLGSLFFSAIAAITAMVAIIWKPGFKLIMAYFKSKDCLQRNLYLNCVSLWKALKANRMVRLNKCSSWSRVLISVTWVELLWAVYRFYRINNIGLKCSFVRCRKYYKSWWNGRRRRASHLGRFTLWHNGGRATKLCRFTLWHNGRRAMQLGRFTLWHNGSRATQLCRFTLWNNGRRATQLGRFTFFVAQRLPKLLKDERFERFSKNRSIVDLQQTLEICTLYEDSANF